MVVKFLFAVGCQIPICSRLSNHYLQLVVKFDLKWLSKQNTQTQTHDATMYCGDTRLRSHSVGVEDEEGGSSVTETVMSRKLGMTCANKRGIQQNHHTDRYIARRTHPHTHAHTYTHTHTDRHSQTNNCRNPPTHRRQTSFGKFLFAGCHFRICRWLSNSKTANLKP